MCSKNAFFVVVFYPRFLGWVAPESGFLIFLWHPSARLRGHYFAVCPVSSCTSPGAVTTQCAVRSHKERGVHTKHARCCKHAIYMEVVSAGAAPVIPGHSWSFLVIPGHSSLVTGTLGHTE